MIIGNSEGEGGLKSLKENIIMKLNKNFQRSSGGGGVVGGTTWEVLNQNILHTYQENPSDWKFVTIIFLLPKYIKEASFWGISFTLSILLVCLWP